MPNTKSAERRVRRNERRNQFNKGVKTKVKSAEKKFAAMVAAGNHTEAAKLISAVFSAYDRAAKSGVLNRGTADRKKSRLTLQLNKTATAKPTAKK